MEIGKENKLFQNCLIIYPDIEAILKINESFIMKKSENNDDIIKWNILSQDFCDYLECFKTNKADIFACFNLFERIKNLKNTFINEVFEMLNLFNPQKLSFENRSLFVILQEFEDFIKNVINNKYSYEEIYLTIITILYIFLQEAITGSSFMFIKESEKTDYSKDLDKFNENKFFLLEKNIPESFKKQSYDYLTVNGESPYTNIKLVFLFIISHHLIVKSNIFDIFEVNKLWKSRVLFLHDKMLRDPTPFIKDQIFKYFESFKLQDFEYLYNKNTALNILQSISSDHLDLRDFKILEGLLKLEKSFISLRYYQYKECQKLIEEAKDLFELKINLTGRLGRKTKYQDFDVPILVVESVSSTLDKYKEITPENITNEKTNLPDESAQQENTDNNTKDTKEEEELLTGIPKKISLKNENPLLENPNITDSNVVQATSLSLYDQIYITALLNSYKHTYPDEDLLREVILTYVNKSIEKSYDWLVFSKLLLHKSLAEEKKSKTIERSLLQIESLCLQYNDRFPNFFSRMKFIFTIDYPFIWKLKKFYAEMFMSYGAFMTAFDLFEELKMDEECVNCLYLAGKNEKALEFAENVIKTRPDPGVYCVLGEINKKEEYFLKALEVSNYKYTRAYRCLGKFKLIQNMVDEAINYYEKAMEINPVFPDIWFSLGCLYLRKQNWAFACRSFAKSVQLDDSSSEGWANLGISFVKLGKNREALKALEESQKCGRRNWQTIENLIYVAIDCQEIQKIINGINDLFDLDKNDRVTPNIFYKLITLLLSKYHTLEKRQIEFFKDKLYQIFERFSMKDGTTPEIWDLYIFFIESTEIKLNSSILDDDDVQKFYQAMIEIRLKQIRNYMILDLWEKDEKSIDKISKLIQKLKSESEKIKDTTYLNEINNFIETTQAKIDKYHKLKDFEKNNLNI